MAGAVKTQEIFCDTVAKDVGFIDVANMPKVYIRKVIGRRMKILRLLFVFRKKSRVPGNTISEKCALESINMRFASAILIFSEEMSASLDMF